MVSGQLYGLEKFWAFIKYYKNSHKLEVDSRLNDYLSKFKTIEDFRVVEPEINEMLQAVGSLRSQADKRRHRSLSESEGVPTSSKNQRSSNGQGQRVGSYTGRNSNDGSNSNQGNRKRFAIYNLINIICSY